MYSGEHEAVRRYGWERGEFIELRPPGGLIVADDAKGDHPLPFRLTSDVPGVLVPAHAVGSGWLDRMLPVGGRIVPVDFGRSMKELVEAGEAICWITNEVIEPGHLNLDHVIPYSYGGATNAANLLPATDVANRARSNSLDLLHEHKIGWKWDFDSTGRQVRVPDHTQRLVRVETPQGPVYWSVPKFAVGELAFGAAASAGFAVGIDAVVQWRTTGEVHADALAEQAARAAVGYSARYSAKLAVRALAPRAVTLVGPAGVAQLGQLAGPVGFVAALYGAEGATQIVARARGQVTTRQAATNFVLAPVSAAKDTAELVVYGYKLVSPKQRAIRKTRARWRSINFIPDMDRPDRGRIFAA